MPRNHNRRARVFQPAKGSRRSNLQTRGPAHVSVVNGPSRTHPFPKEFSFAASHYERGFFEGAASTIAALNVGIFEFLNRRPLYVEQFYALYKYCRITAVRIEFEVNTMSATTVADPNQATLNMAIGVLPFEDLGVAGARRIIESPDSVWTTVGNPSGSSRNRLVKTYVSQRMFGNPVYASQYWMSQTQSVLTTPQDVRAPVAICVVQQPDNLVPTRFSYTVRATYHMQWFDRILPAPSASLGTMQAFDDEVLSAMDEEAIPVPEPKPKIKSGLLRK